MSNEYGFDQTVPHLENEDFDSGGKLKLNPGKPVIIFIGGSFCGWCRKAAPEFQKFVQMASHCYPVTIQLDGSQSEKVLSKRLNQIVPNFQGVPMVVAFKDGNFVKEHTGPRTAQSYLKFSMNV